MVNELHRNGCRRFIVDYTGQKKKKIISIVEECRDPASLQKISTLSSTYTSTKKGRITVNLFCTELEKKTRQNQIHRLSAITKDVPLEDGDTF